MLLPGGLSAYGFAVDNWGATPSATPGTSITANATPNAEGSWTEILADLAQDCYWIELYVHTSSGTGDRQILLDIGADPAGGTSYSAIISNIVVGNVGAVTTTGGGQRFLFPYYLKATTAVAARIQCSQASITMRVAIRVIGQPSNSACVPVGQFSETIGTITNSQGVGFTPGNAADGSWQSLGTTAKAMWWWQLAFSVANGTITAEYTHVELAYGDVTNKRLIIKATHGGTTGETIGDLMMGNRSFSCFCPVPAGATLYVRGRCNNAPDTGYNAVAVGIGG
jgi:hypothetical protein